MDRRILGLVAILMGMYAIWTRYENTDEQIRQQNWLFALLRMKRRYGEKEYRQNVRARIILGGLFMLFGVYWLISGL
jgi:hypothetical protein